MTSGPDGPTDLELQALPREVALPPELEERIVAALREKGALTPRRPATSRLWLAAAAVACFAAGWLGRGFSMPRAASAETGPLYLILLSQLPDSPDAADEARLVDEYRSWAESLERAHQLVRAERLAPEAKLVVPPALPAIGGRNETTPTPSGFFLIRAKSLGDAVAVARGCPHLRHGGSLSVHTVDTT